jgi:hypothetical protein
MVVLHGPNHPQVPNLRVVAELPFSAQAFGAGEVSRTVPPGSGKRSSIGKIPNGL